jgi:hypothetical protein
MSSRFSDGFGMLHAKQTGPACNYGDTASEIKQLI